MHRKSPADQFEASRRGPPSSASRLNHAKNAPPKISRKFRRLRRLCRRCQTWRSPCPRQSSNERNKAALGRRIHVRRSRLSSIGGLVQGQVDMFRALRCRNMTARRQCDPLGSVRLHSTQEFPANRGILRKSGRLAKLYPSTQQNQLVADNSLQNETGN
jgi:hypothetical protein